MARKLLILLLQSSLICGTLATPGPSPKSLRPSRDGTCGGVKGYTCQGSQFGQCCSKRGYCGSGTAYCGQGCQKGFGVCSTQHGPWSSNGTAIAAQNPTSTAGSDSSLSTGLTGDPSTQTGDPSTQTGDPSTQTGDQSTQTGGPSTQMTTATDSTATAVDAPTPVVTAKAQKVCDGSSAQLLLNPSFESGLDSWSASGGAAAKTNSDTSRWGFVGTDGDGYLRLESTRKNSTSAVSQTFSVTGDTVTLSYDWAYSVINPRDGPVRTTCTLATSVGGRYSLSVDGWSRPGLKQGGTGHVETTLSTGGAGNSTATRVLKINFFCTSNDFLAGVMIDNVQLRSC